MDLVHGEEDEGRQLDQLGRHSSESGVNLAYTKKVAPINVKGNVINVIKCLWSSREK